MKWFQFLFAFLLLSPCALSQTKDDEKQVRSILRKMHEAWDEHDYAYTKYDIFDDSAILINPVGMVLKNKNEITGSLQFLGEARFKYLKIIKDSVLSFRFLSPTVAFVVAETSDVVTQDFSMPGGAPGGKEGEISRGIFSYSFTKRNGNWKIISMQVTHAN